MAGTVWDKIKLAALPLLLLGLAFSALQNLTVVQQDAALKIFSQINDQPCLRFRDAIKGCTDEACTSSAEISLNTCLGTMETALREVNKVCSGYVENVIQCREKHLNCNVYGSNYFACRAAVEYRYINSIK